MNRINIFRHLNNIKKAAFKPENLFATNTISSGVLFAIGDSIQQKVRTQRNHG